MKALSISSNERVALPSTRLSMRIQAISYRNEAAPVIPAATSSQRTSRSGAPGAPSRRLAWEATPGRRAALTDTANATARLIAPAIIVPGSPKAPTK